MIRKYTLFLIATIIFMTLGLAGTALGMNRADTFILSPNIGGFSFDSDLSIEDEITYGLGIGYNYTEHLGVEAAINYIDAEYDIGSGDVEGYFYRVDALYHFLPDQPIVPYIAAGLGAFTFDPENNGSETEFAGNYGAGLKFFLTDAMALRADVRHVMTFPENNLLYTAGLAFNFGGKSETEPVSAAASEMSADSDGDNVPDDLDQCLETPSGVAVDARGCPLDSDGDGVFDYKDECPDSPVNAAVDMTGCVIDSDKDGIPDDNDRCPDTPAGMQVNEEGCPADSDNDGVIDVEDNCPNTPEGADVNDRGCWIIKNLRFETDQSVIQSSYYDELANIIRILKQNPDMKVEIQGYTDSRGGQEYNQNLSERRARSVKEFLAENGIDKFRLSYKGYGESNPVASNETAEGRAKNRRVEIKPVQ